MSVIGFNHYNLRAPRKLLDELKDFYCTVVGLTPGCRPPFRSFGYWLYAGEHDILHLTEAGQDEVRVVDVATTFDHVAFTCTNLPEAEARLAQYKIKYQRDVVPLTGQQQLFLRDPAGNGVELNFQENVTAFPARGRRVVEQVTFQLVEGAQDGAFLAAVEQSNLFLRSCAGFVNRHLAKQSHSGTWLDLVFWESMEAALAAAAKFNSSPETEAFNAFLKKGTVSMSHYEFPLRHSTR